jgi:CRISPR-associated exonuclease Cas4
MGAENELKQLPDVTGVMMNYYHVCHRELWYFAHHIEMEHDSDLVLLGRLVHQESYSRDTKEMLLEGRIRLDRITRDGVVHEVKKSNKVEQAHLWQLKYYLYLLKRKGIDGIRGRLDYPRLRRTVEVELTQADEKAIEEKIKAIRAVLALPAPPKVKKMKICRSCSYQELCWG